MNKRTMQDGADEQMAGVRSLKKDPLLNKDNTRIDGVDQRVGMGIGGWDMLWTATHTPTGCAVTWRTRGGEPKSQHSMRERALVALEMIVEVYPKEQVNEQ